MITIAVAYDLIMVTNGERDRFKSARSFPTMTVSRNPPRGRLGRTKMLPVIAGGNIAVTRVPVPGQRERKERRPQRSDVVKSHDQ